MKVISLNTWMGIVREPLMAFFAAHADADVFCLQEMFSNAVGKGKEHSEYEVDFELFEHLAELLKDTHTGYFEPTIGDYYGISIFVKTGIEVLEQGSALIYENPEWTETATVNLGGHDRKLQYVRVVHAGKPLIIVNVHGMYKEGAAHLDIPERIEQSKRIRQFLATHPTPAILIGDFNLDLATESVRILDDGMKNLVKESGTSSTRTRFYPLEDLYADYAIVSPEIEVLDFKVLPDEVSDHAPLYLEIK